MRPHLGELIKDAFHYRWTHPDPRMDRLHAEVSAAVAAGADRKEPADQTFAQIVALAGSTPVTVERPAEGRRPPRLTEPWFC